MSSRLILSEKKRKYTYFVINFDYDEDLVDAVKQIPTADFNGKNKMWYVRLSNETAPYIYKLVTDYGFETTEAVLDKIKNIMRKKKGLYSLSNAEDATVDLPDLPEGLKPYPFQKAGVKYMVTAKRCFNGDDMGLGKTVQAIIAMEKTEAFPHIIICPAGVKKKWRREVKKWLPHRSSAILNDLNFSYHHDIMILNYEVILKYLVREEKMVEGNNKYHVREQIKRIDLAGLTVDECHYTKNRTSKRTQAVKELAKGIEYVWMLSGTIIENRPKEFITQLQILDRLNDFGGYHNFIKTYCDAKMEWHGHMNKDGASNLQELNKKLRQTCLVRRKKEEIESQIPEKLPSRKIKVDINTRDDYQLAENNIFQYLEKDRDRKMGNTFDFYNDVAKEREMNEEAIELQIINALRKITAFGKIDSGIEWIERFLKTGKKLVVFAHHKEVQRRLIKYFPNCAKILGGMSTTEKNKNEMMFQDNEDCKLIVCSLKAANMGIDLFASHSVLFFELGWTPSIHEQAGDRCHRLGQTEDVQPYYLLGKNTIDIDMYDLLEEKAKVVNASLDGSDDDDDTSILNELIERMKKKGKLHIPENYEGKQLT